MYIYVFLMPVGLDETSFAYLISFFTHLHIKYFFIVPLSVPHKVLYVRTISRIWAFIAKYLQTL